MRRIFSPTVLVAFSAILCFSENSHGALLPQVPREGVQFTRVGQAHLAGATVSEVSVSPDGKTVSIGRSDGVVQVLDCEDFSVLNECTSLDGRIAGLCFPNDQSVLFCSVKGDVFELPITRLQGGNAHRAFEVRGQDRRFLDETRDLQYHPNAGLFCLSGGVLSFSSSGDWIDSVSIDCPQTSAFAVWTGDRPYVALATMAGGIYTYQLDSGVLEKAAILSRETQWGDDIPYRVQRILISPDGHRIAIRCNKRPHSRILIVGQTKSESGDRDVATISLSDKEMYWQMVNLGHEWLVCSGSGIKIWNWESKAILSEFSEIELTGSPFQVEYPFVVNVSSSERCHRIVTVGYDGHVEKWEVSLADAIPK